MAMHDWNGNGKDHIDDFIEYQVYNDVSGKNNGYSSRPSGNGMSTFGAIVSVVGGLFWQAALYTTLGIEVDDVPMLVILILWVVFSMITAAIVNKIGL